MKKLFSKIKNFISEKVQAIKSALSFRKVKFALANRSGESYVDSAVKILIAIVIGALLLAGLYALFGDTVMPTLTRRIQEMFNYNG